MGTGLTRRVGRPAALARGLLPVPAAVNIVRLMRHAMWRDEITGAYTNENYWIYRIKKRELLAPANGRPTLLSRADATRNPRR